MANSGGVITRKDVIEDQALQWGEVYAKEVQKAIDKNQEFLRIVQQLATAIGSIRGATNFNQLAQASQQANATVQAGANIWREQIALENRLISTQRQRELATEATNRALVLEREQLRLTNQQVRAEVRDRGGLIGAYERLNTARRNAQQRLQNLLAAETQNTAEIRRAQAEFDRLERRIRAVNAATNNYTQNIGNYRSAMSGAISMGRELISSLGIVAGIGAFVGVMKDAFATIKKFDQAVADLKAITGATGKDLEFLRKQAIELGKDTKGGAVAVVEAYKLIASAKPELLENVKALNQVTEATLTLSKAAGMEMPDAATALTDAMNQFNAPAEQAGIFIDALANGAKYGAAEIPQVTEALLKFGAVAKTSNISIQESTALIELLAEKGVKGADAGVMIRNVLLKISAPDAIPRRAREELEKLGVSFEMLRDKTIPVQQKLENLKPLLKDNASIVKVFGLENATAAINLISHTERIKELTSKMFEFGTAEEQAAIRMNTLQGKSEKLSSTYDSLILNLNEGNGAVSSFFNFFVDGATNAIIALTRLNTSWEDLYVKAKLDGEKLGEKAYNTEGKSIERLQEERKKLFDDIGKYNKEIQKVQKELDDINPYAIHLSGPSPKDLKERLERLNNFLGQTEAAYNKSRNKIIELTTGKKEKEKLQEQADLEDSAKKAEESEKAKKAREEREKKQPEELKKRRQEYLKMLQKNEEAEYNLHQFRLQNSIDINREIIDSDKATLQEKINAINELAQVQETKTNQSLQHEIVTNALKGIDAENTSEKQMDIILKEAKEKYEILLKGNEDVYNLNEKELEIFTKLNNTEKLIFEKWQKEKIGIEKNTLNETEKAQKDAAEKLLQEFKDRVEDLKGIEREKQLLAQDEQDALDKKYAQGKIDKENYEKEKFEIEHKYLKLSLNEQIDVIEKELEKLADTDEKKTILAEILRDLKHKISLANIDDIRKETEAENERWNILKQQASSLAATLGNVLGFDSSNLDLFFNKMLGGFEKGNDGLMHWKSGFKDWEDAAKVSLGAVKDITNAVFQGNIDNIQAEIDANEEYYSHQIELAGDDQRKKDDLQKEKDKKDKSLKEKLKKEKEKQAIANRIAAVAEIGISTAQGIMQIWAHSPDPTGISQGTLTAIIAALGAIQIATVLATPLPKYKHGRTGGPSEWAIVGDGGRSEVIERASGLVQMTPNTDTLVKLERGDKVHSSVDKYYELQQIAFQKDLSNQHQKALSFQNYSYGKESLSVLKNIEKSLKNQKNTTIINVPKMDLNHELWKMNNKKWS